MKYKYNGQWVDVTLNALEGMPIGSIIQFAGNVIPTGWLKCDGSSLSEEEYPQLYDVIGYTYGGSGLSFNLPNFNGRVPVGIDANDTDFDRLGETGGEKTHTLTVNEMPSHRHYTNVVSIGSGGNETIDGSLSVSRNVANSDGARGSYTGGDLAHNNLQPYLVVNYIIKASQTTPTFATINDTRSTSTTEGYSCNYVNNLVDYSTTEINTGKKWIDGKPIYRKVIEDTTNSTANVWKSLSLTNVDHIISYSGELVASLSETFVLPMGTDTRAIWFKVTSNTLHEAHNTDYFNSKDMVLIVEYTKTTD